MIKRTHRKKPLILKGAVKLPFSDRSKTGKMLSKCHDFHVKAFADISNQRNHNHVHEQSRAAHHSSTAAFEFLECHRF